MDMPLNFGTIPCSIVINNEVKLMRVLLITDNHTPEGGAEKYFFALKEILKTQQNIEVYSLGFGPQSAAGKDYLVLKGGNSNFSKLLWRMFFHPIKFWQIRRYIKKINPDVIHLHNVKKYTISLLKAVQGQCHVVQTIHDYSLVCPTAWNLHSNLSPCPTGLTSSCKWEHKRDWNKLIYFALLYCLKRRQSLTRKTVNHFLVPSPLLQKNLLSQNFKNIHFLPNFKKENASYHFEKIQPNHFLYLGQLAPHKGVDILINEFHLAYQKNKNLILKIAGKGPQEEALKNQVKNLKLENNIFFLGWTNEIEKLITETVALIFPSIGLEPYPTVLIEAMSYARAIIGSDRGPTSWMVDANKTGLLFDPLKKGELANCMLSLADNISYAEELGKNGFKKFQTFPNNDQIVKEILSVYKNTH